MNKLFEIKDCVFWFHTRNMQISSNNVLIKDIPWGVAFPGMGESCPLS